MTSEQIPPWPASPAVFLDLDGTLVEIAETPDAARASDELKRVLAVLPEVADGALAIVSGRTVRDVDRVLAPHRMAVAGVHGMERRRADGRTTLAESENEWVDPAWEAIQRFARRHRGLIPEHKDVSLALHYRNRPELEHEVIAFIDGLDVPSHVAPLHGRKVVELKPGDVDKGKAIRAFMSEPPFRQRTPVFVGDDVTDETGFLVVNELGGVSVKVGPGNTAALWTLPGVPDVLSWLSRAADAGMKAGGVLR